MELISPLLRTDFREFCVAKLVLRQIDDIFAMAGIRKGILAPDRQLNGERRTLVEEYYASIDWSLEADCVKFLKVLGFTFAQTYLAQAAKDSLRESCERAGLVVDGGSVRRNAIRTIEKRNTSERERPNRITEITRRDLFDALSAAEVRWWGRLSEVEFLSRVYDLKTMPSTDGRFTDAASDVWQHRGNNYDWPDSWVYYDDRFGLLTDPDQQLFAIPLRGGSSGRTSYSSGSPSSCRPDQSLSESR